MLQAIIYKSMGHNKNMFYVKVIWKEINNDKINFRINRFYDQFYDRFAYSKWEEDL